jgi:hypothetical protein
MEGDSMKKITGRLLLLCFALGTIGVCRAQEQSMAPPKVLLIIREFLKPGKAGSPHLKTESAFVNAFTAAKWPQHYFAVDSMSGMPRSLFLVGYDSFADWEKDNSATQKNAALSAALDKASVADGELLSSYESSTFVFREDLSFQASVNIAQMRYFEISRFHVKPGHGKEFEAIVKMYQDGYKKAVPDSHWAVFEDMYGKDSGGSFVLFVPMKSLAEVDKGFGDSKKFSDAMGEEGMKKLSGLTASAMDQAESNLFVFNPKLSYPPAEWIKADPEFWKPKATAPAKIPAKPAQ